MNTRVLVAIVIVTVSLLTACASPLMKPVEDEGTEFSLKSEEAQIIFMRPSNFGGGVQSSVFELRPGDDRFIGIVSANTKLRYVTEPGEHLLMVIGESADFMRAYVDEGKTYYALVAPRMGVWKARFSLIPIRRQQIASEEFIDWDEQTGFVESTTEAE